MISEKNEVENLYDDDVLEKASATTPPSQIEATPSSETADVTATLAPPTTQSTPTQEQNSDPEMQGTEDRYIKLLCAVFRSNIHEEDLHRLNTFRSRLVLRIYEF